jgi:putative transcriptional regulator
MKIQNRFRVLLAEKETREGRTISLREIHEITGVPMHTLTGLRRNRAKMIAFDSLCALCQYLDCQINDLLEMIEDDGEIACLSR